MQFKIKLNVSLIKSFIFSSTHRILFENVSNLEKFSGSVLHTTGFDLNISPSEVYLYVFEDFEPNPVYNYTKANIDTASTTGDYFTFDCLVADSDIEDLLFLVRNGLVELINANNTYIACYKQNDENDALNKKLTFVKLLMIQFKSTLSMKQFYIDVANYEFDFNYIYIPVLKRYYYVNSVEMMNKYITRLNLQEDVLMSWEDLIRRQSAFVTRYENATNVKLVDERRPLEDVPTIEYITLTNTTTGSKKNITLTTQATNPHNILLTCLSWDSILSQIQTVTAPDTNLPTITESVHSPIEKRYLLTNADLGLLQNAIVKNHNATSPIDIDSFINSLIWLPFDLITPYESTNITGLSITLTNNTYLKITNNGEFGTGSTNSDQVYESWLCASPYFVLEDFELNVDVTYLNNKPNSQWEIYIAFVGWVEIDINQVNNSRLIIYYTIDEKTGQGTANLYNMSSHKLIYSTNCQLGFKIDYSKTNADELARQQQTNVTNTILGLLTSAISIGVGVVTENPLAVVGGVLSAGKTIASAVNTNNMMFARAQTTFGGGDTSIHTPLTTAIRKTYHNPLTIDETTYTHLQGKPYKNYTALSALSGYVEVGDLHFDLKGEDIYQDEVQEIVQLLKNGVIF